MEEKKLDEALTGFNSRGESFTHFVCLVYVHISVEKRTKMGPSRKKGLFSIYSETSRAYKIYILVERKKVVNRDVNFKENFASKKYHVHIPIIEDGERETSKFEPMSPMTFNLRKKPLGVEE